MATLETFWTDAPILYFHFNAANGCFASLPMIRVVYAFSQEFKGVPGTGFHVSPDGDSEGTWLVPGYKCLNCAKVFFAATRDDLKHECMNHGGVISDSKSMGA